MIIITSGDPSLESRFFPSKSFIKELKSKLLELNIKSITGKIKIYPDFDTYQVNNQWLWSDLGNYYGSGYSLHSFKDNYVEVSFNSGNEIGSATKIVKIDPLVDSFFSKIMLWLVNLIEIYPMLLVLQCKTIEP